MEVRLRGAAEAVLATDTIEVSDASSLRSIVVGIASLSPELERQLLHRDGTPRSASRLLVDGVPVASLDTAAPAGGPWSLSPVMSCDG